MKKFLYRNECLFQILFYNKKYKIYNNKLKKNKHRCKTLLYVILRMKKSKIFVKESKEKEELKKLFKEILNA